MRLPGVYLQSFHCTCVVRLHKQYVLGEVREMPLLDKITAGTRLNPGTLTVILGLKQFILIAQQLYDD